MKNKSSKNIIYLFAFILLATLVYTQFTKKDEDIEKVAISKVAEEVKEDKIKSISIQGGAVEVTLKDDKKQKSDIGEGESITTVLKDFGADPAKISSLEVKEAKDNSLLFALLTGVLPILLIVGFFFLMLRQAQGGQNQASMFGASKAKLFDPKKNKTTFKDVAGAEEAKQELQEIVEFLKFPKKFLAMGAKIPKGVLLFGNPGTGKTLMARAVAGEANVPFFSISGSEFVEMFVGVGASRVRDLFNKAKKNAPSIIFIDEIDAVGRQRGSGLGGSHDEREQTLNQILVEMDGFEQETNVIVMAATNRPDVLDPALQRPGRFDRRVVISLPDIKDRVEILKIHARKKPLADDVKLETIAKTTPGFAGADLENIMNEAAILAARENKKKITNKDMQEAIEKIFLGPEKKNRVLSEKEREITAYHEAGHAVVGHILPLTDPIHKVTIIPRGMALGVTWSLPVEDKFITTKAEIEDSIAMTLGGRAAEELIFKQPTTGAENDLRKATKLARKVITEYGMSEKLGNRVFGHKEEMVFLGRDLGENKDYSEATAREIDLEVKQVIDLAYAKALKVLNQHKDKLELVAKKLVKEETIESTEFEALFTKKKTKEATA